jgi:hypothetical protein
MAYNLGTRSQRLMKYPYIRPGGPYVRPQPVSGGVSAMPMPMPIGTRGIEGGQGQQPGGGFQGGFQGQQPGGEFQGGFQGQQPGGEFQGGFQGQQPGGEFQGQVGPQQGLGMTQPTDITPQEKMVLRGVLDILKETRAALTRSVSDEMDDVTEQRQTAAQAYLCGFMEAKGQQELGEYLSTIPPVSTRGVVDAGEYDEMIDTLEQLVDPETRILPVLGAIAVSAAGSALWDISKGPLKRGAKKLVRKIRR